jgi:hypothetical protein
MGAKVFLKNDRNINLLSFFEMKTPIAYENNGWQLHLLIFIQYLPMGFTDGLTLPYSHSNTHELAARRNRLPPSCFRRRIACVPRARQKQDDGGHRLF